MQLERRSKWACAASPFLILISISTALGADGDVDGNGYIDLRDLSNFTSCVQGPLTCAGLACIQSTDMNGGGTVDLADFALFQSAQGHTPVPLKDPLGNWIELGSTAPYSGRKTCGPCHDLDTITNGYHFQQGRTDTAGNVTVHADYFQDGRTWEMSPGRYGRFSQATARVLARQTSENESQIDSTPFEWIQYCSNCHPGGGPGEFDREGRKLFDEETGLFGYEFDGLASEDVRLDGDYAFMDRSTGELSQAPWDVTGVSAPDCLTCHRTERTWDGSTDMNRTWRNNILNTGAALTDYAGNPIPAFLSAATAGQGWFSAMDTSADPPKLQIDYFVGILDGSLVSPDLQHVSIGTKSLRSPPRDRVCFGCHRDMSGVAGIVWFDERDVHYAKFNNRSDEDPTNDISDDYSTACNYCHPGNPEHNFAFGNSLQIQQRKDLAYVGLRSCRDCHLDTSPVRHPDAPIVPGDVTVHLVRPFEILSCQACHMPYLYGPAALFIDTMLGGAGRTTQYLSADPLDPSNPDKSRWYPPLKKKMDSDGVERWFPTNYWVNIYWADWDKKGTPEDMTDDTLEPILQWRINQITGGEALPGITDDNGDGKLEINRPAEILTYINTLKGNDNYGRQVAANPVLIKGKWLWYEDAQAPDGVSSLMHVGTPLPVRWEAYSWDVNHNMHVKEEAWGVGEPPDNCAVCHDRGNSPVLDRKVLVDPYGPDGQPVYETVRSMTGLNPP